MSLSSERVTLLKVIVIQKFQSYYCKLSPDLEYVMLCYMAFACEHKFACTQKFKSNSWWVKFWNSLTFRRGSLWPELINKRRGKGGGSSVTPPVTLPNGKTDLPDLGDRSDVPANKPDSLKVRWGSFQRSTQVSRKIGKWRLENSTREGQSSPQFD